MSSRQPRVSLRRKNRISKEDLAAEESEFEQLKSPIRKRGTDQTNTVPSPTFRSPVHSVIKSAKLCKTSPSSRETFLDESFEKLSQEPTPSKWSSLLPDFSSQADGDAGEVHWDCASPDVVKHLKRLQKDNKSIKDIIKNFKPAKQQCIQSSPPQLPLTRVSVLKKKQTKVFDKEKAKQRKLAQRRRQAKENWERGKELFGRILSAEVKQEADGEQQETEKSEAAVTDVITEVASRDADADTDDKDDEWEDDDLFENNSMIIAATQDPYQFLSASSASKTSTPKLVSNKRLHRTGNCTETTALKSDTAVVAVHTAGAVSQCKLRLSEDCPYASDNSDSADSQSSTVIPPTLVPATSKLLPAAQGAAACRALRPKRNIAPRKLIGSFAELPEKEEKSEEHSVVTRCGTCAMSNSKDDRPGNQLVPSLSGRPPQVAGPHCSISVTKLTTSQNTACGAGSKRTCSATVSESRSAASSKHDRLGNHPVSNLSCQPAEGKRLPRLTSVAKSESSQLTVSGARVRSACTAGSSKAISVQGNAVRCKQPVSVHSHVGSKHSKVSDQADQRTLAGFSSTKRSYVSGGASLDKMSDMADDDLSDELLLTLTEPDAGLDSVVIQEFPTQPPAKLSAPTTLTCMKPVSCEVDDFADDLDPEILATISEFDSFSESPKCVAKTTGQMSVKPVPQNPSHTVLKTAPVKYRQGELQDTKQQKTVTSTHSRSTVNTGKMHGVGHDQMAISKPVSSDNRLQGHKDNSSAPLYGNAQSSKNPESNRGLVYPPFAPNQQQNPRPLSSLAVGNTGLNRPPQAGKRFVFKSLPSSTSARNGVAVPVSSAGSSKAVQSGAGASVCGVTNKQVTGDNADDIIDDDPLFESQILAVLDEVEASQQSSSQVVGSSQGLPSTELCSQEQIEKKRQAALKRRQARVKKH